MKKISLLLLSLLLALSLLFSGCSNGDLPFMDDPDDEPILEEKDDSADKGTEKATESGTDSESASASVSDSAPIHSIGKIPPYAGTPYVAINDNIPEFKDAELTTGSYEAYSPLDSLGRCGVAIACIGTDLMPTEDRESIGSVTPSGWVNNRYDTELVSGGYIYNRSHMIGFQLTGENANKLNLITGTRYFNVEGMLPFENMVADYLKEEPENHVMYRVTPIFEGNNLVVHGVQIEAYSVEDHGDGICFNVYIYNVQPGIYIDYATGNNWLDSETPPLVTDTESASITTETAAEIMEYILNTSSEKFHEKDCAAANNIGAENRREYSGTREALIALGYSPCGVCKP